MADVKGFAASKQQLGMDTAMQRTWTVNIAGLLESAYDAAKPWKKASFGMVREQGPTREVTGAGQTGAQGGSGSER